MHLYEIMNDNQHLLNELQELRAELKDMTAKRNQLAEIAQHYQMCAYYRRLEGNERHKCIEDGFLIAELRK